PGLTLDEYFDHVTRQGFTERLSRLQQLAAAGRLRHTIDEYERRLSYELDMIKKMEYPAYFLIGWDFIRYAREQGTPVCPARGAAPEGARRPAASSVTASGLPTSLRSPSTSSSSGS